MKKIIQNILLASIVVFSSTSCTKWLDVKPADQVTEEEQFSNEQGFSDALIGVYVNLGETTHYGAAASFYDLDILAQYYRFTSSDVDSELASYNYSSERGRSLSFNIWGDAYSEIANINNLLRVIDEKGEGFFSADNHNLIKGEALALRAFLHFDVYRTYAPNVKIDPTFVLPYTKELSTTASVGIPTSEFLNSVIEDLASASDLLKDIDPIIDNSASKFGEGTRANYFNYYAINALLARVYSNMGENTKALQYANTVINSNMFNFVSLNDVTVRDDKIFSDEIIFGIYQQKLNTIQLNYFNPISNGSKLVLERTDLVSIYQGQADDIRNKLFQDYFGGDYAVLTKYANSKSSDDEIGDNDFYNPTIPVIRLSEMHLIVATSSSDIAERTMALNSVRDARLISSLDPATITSDELDIAITEEYRKEMIGDGQLFFYYKKFDITPKLGDITSDYPNWNSSNFIVPIPDTELELGNL